MSRRRPHAAGPRAAPRWRSSAVVAAWALALACGRTEPVDLLPEELPARDGGADGGRDAGRDDGGVADGGRVDGGVVDAGPTDAGPVCPIAFDATTTARVRITADDEYVLYANGQLIDRVPHPWTSPQSYMVTFHRHPARPNLLAVEATNRFNQDGLDRGLLVDVVTGSGANLVSDGRWRTFARLDAGWDQPGYDDASWPLAVVLGPHGSAPWGSVLGVSFASWLWRYVPSAPAAQKPTVERTWFRRVFHFTPDGGLTGVPGLCP